MASIFKELKREIKAARFIAELKSIRSRATHERTSSTLNENQFHKLCCFVNSRIEKIAVNHRRRLNL